AAHCVPVGFIGEPPNADKDGNCTVELDGLVKRPELSISFQIGHSSFADLISLKLLKSWLRVSNTCEIVGETLKTLVGWPPRQHPTQSRPELRVPVPRCGILSL